MGSDHLSILFTVPLSLISRLCERPPFFNFEKTCWDDYVLHINSHRSSAGEYCSLSSAAALFTSFALKAVKSSICFGRVRCQPQAWWSSKVQRGGSVRERCKAFVSAHRIDEDCSSLSLYMPCRPKPRYSTKHAPLLTGVSEPHRQNK